MSYLYSIPRHGYAKHLLSLITDWTSEGGSKHRRGASSILLTPIKTLLEAFCPKARIIPVGVQNQGDPHGDFFLDQAVETQFQPATRTRVKTGRTSNTRLPLEAQVTTIPT